MGNYSDIIDLCRVVDGTEYSSPEEFVSALEEILNVDAFLRYTAVNTIIDNWDSYPFTGNNYYLFNNPVNNVSEWIPWDLTWGGNSQTPLFSRTGGDLVLRAPLYDQVFEVERYRRQYLAYTDLLLHFWFNDEKMSAKVQKYHHLIAPSVLMGTGDKAFFGDAPMFPVEAFEEEWQNMLLFAKARHQYLEKALKEELAQTKKTVPG